MGELTEEKVAKGNQAFKFDDNLIEEREKLNALSGFLSDVLGTESYSLGEERIAEIHKAGQLPDSKILILKHRRRSCKQSFLAVGWAAVVLTRFVVLS